MEDGRGGGVTVRVKGCMALSDEIQNWLEVDGWAVSAQELPESDGVIWALLAIDQSPNPIRIVAGQSAEMGEQLVVQSHVSLDENLTTKIAGKNDVPTFLEDLKRELESNGLDVAGFDDPQGLTRIGLLQMVSVSGVDSKKIIDAFVAVKQGVQLVASKLHE